VRLGVKDSFSVTSDNTNCHLVRAPKQKFYASVMVAFLPDAASRLQDKPSAAESGSVGAAAQTLGSKILRVGF
jgi:hypothetical protein